MPELPEVETARRCLQGWARGRRIEKVTVRDRRVVSGGGPRALATLEGARFVSFDRRGKHLLLTLDKARRPLGLWSHLGMSGKWLLRRAGEEAPRFSRVELDLDRGGVRLHFVDLRLFGRLRLVPGAAFDKQKVLMALGPDPLKDGIDLPRLTRRLERSSKPIKPLLLDQGLLAGVGNIQASEALFRAAIDPRRRARDLAPPEVRALARGIKASIAYTLGRFEKEIAASRGRDIVYVEEPASFNPFKVYDRAGERCRRCRKGEIQRLVQAGRSTFYCDHHQR